jgi:large subunit ribosomal protein L31
MKADIHPTYYANAKATCACGATYSVGSTKESFDVEICSACHPFYTGQEKVMDTTGRVDRFKKRAAVAKKS